MTAKALRQGAGSISNYSTWTLLYAQRGMSNRWTHSKFRTTAFTPTWLVPWSREGGSNVVPRVDAFPLVCEPTRADFLQLKWATHPLIPSSNRPLRTMFASAPTVRARRRARRYHKKYARTLRAGSNREPLDDTVDRLLPKFQHGHFNRQEIGFQPILRRRLHLAKCGV